MIWVCLLVSYWSMPLMMWELRSVCWTMFFVILVCKLQFACSGCSFACYNPLNFSVLLIFEINKNKTKQKNWRWSNIYIYFLVIRILEYIRCLICANLGNHRLVWLLRLILIFRINERGICLCWSNSRNLIFKAKGYSSVSIPWHHFGNVTIWGKSKVINSESWN